MADEVLVAFDGTEQARAALEHAIEEHPDARITAITVIDPSNRGYSPRAALPISSEDWYEEAKETAKSTLAEAVEIATERDRSIETVVDVGRPAETIVDYARENDVDHIVTGSHSRSGISRIVVGSVAESILRRAPVPVTVVR